MENFDLVVVGGGVNGTGIARDAAGQGLSVLLCEQSDLGGATSWASTKLIHGGLRYLEFYEFRLVREALIEREVLLRAAPHIIRPLRFVLPHLPGLRPAWMIRAGLLLYDHLGGRQLLPGSNGIALRQHVAGTALKPGLTKAFEYSDCRVDDSRLVVLNALDAAERGARILTRTACVSAHRTAQGWRVRMRENDGGNTEVSARALVNAGGPWVSSVQHEVIAGAEPAPLKLVKGSHIVVPRMFDHQYAYIFQNPDRRIVFAIPYGGDFTLVGTTEVEYSGDPADARIEADEIDYLCNSMNRYFATAITPQDVAWQFAGVRPLYDDPEAPATTATRDYALDLEVGDGEAPLMTILGGKLTTYRKLAEHALQKLLPTLGLRYRAWTHHAHLPGGDIEDADFDAFCATLRDDRPWLPDDLARRYAHAYGTRVYGLLGDASGVAGLGEDFGDGLYSSEVDYLVNHEWARSAEDILWRRSKLGLTFAQNRQHRLREYLGDHGDGSALRRRPGA